MVRDGFKRMRIEQHFILNAKGEIAWRFPTLRSTHRPLPYKHIGSMSKIASYKVDGNYFTPKEVMSVLLDMEDFLT